MTPSSYIDMGATLSRDRRYRYLLWREWRGTHDRENLRWSDARDGAGMKLAVPRACVFIMLNPSTADGEVDDATIRKCVGFAKLWRYERLEVVNLFAYRAKNPRVVLRLKHYTGVDPVGPDNQEHVNRTIDRAGIIVCAWGAHGAHLGQNETMLGWLGDKRCYALALTKNGHPRHPLYVPYATAVRFRP